MVLVMGTSLKAAPFAYLPTFAAKRTPRILFDMDKVGDLGSRRDDVVVLGDCDIGVRKLADALRWHHDLDGLWHKVGGKVKEKETILVHLHEQNRAVSQDEIPEADIEETGEVKGSLNLFKEHI